MRGHHHHRFHHHGHGPRGRHRRRWPGNPFRGYIRARLHRRVFAWFGLTIALTGISVGMVSHMVNGDEGYWHKEYMIRARTFLNRQFEPVWDDPARRDAQAKALSEDFGLPLALKDPRGAMLYQVGAPCSRGKVEVPIIRAGQPLGTAQVCLDRFLPKPSRVFLPIAFAIFVLWMASGAITHRLMRPMSMVIGVAEQLGSGNLKSRAPVGRHHGEERALAEALNRMADRIERQMADQRELLAQVSHELRTPLGHVRLLLEIARDQGVTPRTLDELEKEVAEIDALVADLLASSRVTFEALTLRPLDAAELAARALERAGLPADKLELAGRPQLLGDATLLMRALANLLENARAHAGSVEKLKVYEDGGQVAFAVTDSGPGFPAGDEARAFEPFYHRARTENGEGGSLGLGLALVQRIARAHGGEARARNRPEGGAEVMFSVRSAGAAALPSSAQG